MSEEESPDSHLSSVRPPARGLEEEKVRFNWRFAREKGKCGLEALAPAQKRRLEKKLREYEKYTLLSFVRVKGASLRIFDLKSARNAPPAAQRRQVLEEISREIPNPGPLRRFRASGKMRVLGYLPENIFYVVWVDPDHRMGR